MSFGLSSIRIAVTVRFMRPQANLFAIFCDSENYNLNQQQLAMLFSPDTRTQRLAAQ
jgi:hypothetical protein